MGVTFVTEDEAPAVLTDQPLPKGHEYEPCEVCLGCTRCRPDAHQHNPEGNHDG